MCPMSGPVGDSNARVVPQGPLSHEQCMGWFPGRGCASRLKPLLQVDAGQDDYVGFLQAVEVVDRGAFVHLVDGGV